LEKKAKRAEPRRKRLCVIINLAFGFSMLRNEWKYYMEHGFDVLGISGPGPEHHKIVQEMGMKIHVVPIERYPSPLKDFISLIHLWWFLLWHRFDVVHVSTPKAGLLGALAARLSGHSRLIYVVRGRAYENMSGLRRKLMSFCEWFTCLLARRVIPICHELSEVIVKEGLCSVRKIHVIGSGSDRGVDLKQYTLTEEVIAGGKSVREELGIGNGELAILCVGWLRRDKGTNELIRAFNSLAEQYPNIHLILLGNYELTDPLEPEVISSIENHPRIHHLPWRNEPVRVYAASDILAFPSYREGFGAVAIEASAMELPVVASDIMGCREAVKDGVSGLLFPMANAKALEKVLKRLIDEPSLRKELGQNGRNRVEKEFRNTIIYKGMLEQFHEILK